ncbi:MAG: hypothetical protein J6W07_00975, partial [Bacteroidales bacterium]|nr:hypothetical protein [Bacteroidales bacterium]
AMPNKIQFIHPKTLFMKRKKKCSSPHFVLGFSSPPAGSHELKSLVNYHDFLESTICGQQVMHPDE